EVRDHAGDVDEQDLVAALALDRGLLERPLALQDAERVPEDDEAARRPEGERGEEGEPPHRRGPAARPPCASRWRSRMRSISSRSACAMTGIMTFRSRLPFMPATAIVASWPITRAATWLTASGITGFTLPGMILEPGCVAGSSISLSPVRLPDASSRRSLATFMSPTASVRSAPEVSTAASRFCIASKRSGAG